MPLHFKFMFFLWQFGLVDTLGMVNYFVNIGMQYGTIVIASAGVKHLSELSPKILLEPILGLGVSCRYIKAAETLAERRARAATVASFLSLSTTLASTSTPSANGALGGTVAVQIESMRVALAARGGGFWNNSLPFVSQTSLEDYKMVYVSLKTSLTKLYPYREKFAFKSKITIDNIFQSHTAHRYIQQSTQKFNIVVAPAYIAPVAATQINTTAFLSRTLFGVGLIGFTTLTLGALYLFQRAERKRYQNKNYKVVIDGTNFLIDKQ